MTDFYTTSDDVAILRERIEELARIRQDYAASLGSSLYVVTKDNDSLRWGRESLYNGITNCDEERDALLQRIAELEEPWKYVVKEEDPEDTFVPMPIPTPEVEATVTVVDDSNSEAEPEPEFEHDVEVEREAEASLEVEVEQAAEAEIADETAYGYDAELVEPESEFEFDLESAFEPTAEPEPLSTSDSTLIEDTTNISLDQTAVTPAVPVTPTVPDGIVCPTCGTIAAPTQRFCMECGTQLPAPRANVCPHCGSPTEPSFRFCMECGYKLV